MGLVLFIGKKGVVLYISRTINIKEHIGQFIDNSFNSEKKIKKILKEFVRIE